MASRAAADSRTAPESRGPLSAMPPGTPLCERAGTALGSDPFPADAAPAGAAGHHSPAAGLTPRLGGARAVVPVGGFSLESFVGRVGLSAHAQLLETHDGRPASAAIDRFFGTGRRRA